MLFLQPFQIGIILFLIALSKRQNIILRIGLISMYFRDPKFKVKNKNMVEIREIRNYIWLAPFVGGLIGIISVLAPAGSVCFYDRWTLDFWIWGMWVFTSYYGTNTIYLSDLFLTAGIGCSVLTIVFSIIIFITANQIRKKSKSIIDTRILWIASGILIILINITWTVIITFMNYEVILNKLRKDFYYYDFDCNTIIWFFFNVNFGIIGPLISGILAITAGRYSKRFRS